MTTSVQVSVKAVVAVTNLAISTIKAQRLVNVDDWLGSAMLQTKPRFYFECLRFLGTMPKYANRIDALEAMRTPVNMYATSLYLRKTRYYKHDEQHRLEGIRAMAHTSIDDTIRLGATDHALLRSYDHSNQLGRKAA